MEGVFTIDYSLQGQQEKDNRGEEQWTCVSEERRGVEKIGIRGGKRDVKH